MRFLAIRSLRSVVGIYVGFLVYFGGVFALIWYNVLRRFNFFGPNFSIVMLSAGLVGLMGFSYLSMLWRKQIRGVTASRPISLPSTRPAKERRFERVVKMGSFLGGVSMMVLGLAEAVYGLYLYGEKYQALQLAAYYGRPYEGPYQGFLTYAPELVVGNAILVFILGIWMLIYSQS